jgi:predicted RNase H-like nuclease (RuvC/YqgF family)
VTKVKAKKGKAGDDDADSSSSSSSSYGSSSVDAELEKLKKGAGNGTKAGPDEESSDPEFGELNKNAKNKGNKTSVNASVVKSVRKISAAYERKVDKISKENKKLRSKLHASGKKHKELETSVEEMQAQIDNFTENNMGPKALPPAITMLLSKSGIDPLELQASGRKLTVAEVDDMINAGGVSLTPTEKMTMKNNLLEKNLMEMGEITRQ